MGVSTREFGEGRCARTIGADPEKDCEHINHINHPLGGGGVGGCCVQLLLLRGFLDLLKSVPSFNLVLWSFISVASLMNQSM